MGYRGGYLHRMVLLFCEPGNAYSGVVDWMSGVFRSVNHTAFCIRVLNERCYA